VFCMYVCMYVCNTYVCMRVFVCMYAGVCVEVYASIEEEDTCMSAAFCISS